MKIITLEYKENVKLFGRQLDSVITYEIEGDTIELGNGDLNSISPHYEGGLLKSVMKQLDIDSNIEIPLETTINFQFGIKVRDDEVEDYRDNYDYIDFGNYIVYKSEKQEDTNSYKITCYDKMLYSMKDYEDIGITYPVSVRDYINAICTHLGLTFANSSGTFANYDKIIPNELYLSYDSESETYSSLGYTFRDVLDELAEVTASSICINSDEELEIRYITDTEDTIDEEYLKDINVNFGQKYGPINTIVLSRSAGADNIYYPSVLPENPVEFKISDNQIMNSNDRDVFMADIYDVLNGLEYYINDFSSTGITYYDLCDRYNVSIGENTYSCIMLNDDVQITQGLEEHTYTDLPEESVTDYTKADSTDRRINQTYLMVNKQEGIIQSLVDNTTYVSDTKTGVGSIQLENAYEGQLYKLSIKGNINLLFPQSESVYGYPLVPKDGLVPSNELTPSSPVPYGNEVYYPSAQLFTKSQNLIIDDVKYKLDFDFLNYLNAQTYDEFVYNNGTCYIIRRIGIDEEGEMYALDNEVIEPRKGIVLNVKSDSIISLESFPNAMLSATYLLQNTFTDNFATEVYVKSEITQTANEINEQVSAKVGDEEIIAKLNLAVRDGQGIINLTGNQVTIDSDNFILDADGKITSVAGEIGGFNLSSDKFHSTSTKAYNFVQSDLTRVQQIIAGTIIPTSSDYEKYDIDNSHLIDALDMLRIQKIVTGTLSSNQICKYIINSQDPARCISITDENESTEMISLGMFGGYMNQLSTNSLRVKGTLYFKPDEATGYTIQMRASDGSITCVSLTQTSLEEYKKNIEKYTNALETINNTDIYTYNLKNEKDNTKKRIGFVIGNKYNYSKDITTIDNDGKEVGADIYSMVSVCFQAIKEQQEIIEKLKIEIEELKNEK